MGREPVHSESNMMKIIILTLAAAAVVLGAPPASSAVYRLEEASDPRRALEDFSKFDAEAIEKRSAGEEKVDKIAGFVCPIVRLFYLLIVRRGYT